MSIERLNSLPEKGQGKWYMMPDYDRKVVEDIRRLHGCDREYPKFFRPFTKEEILKGDFGLFGSYSPIGIEYRQINSNHAEQGKKIQPYGYDYRINKDLPHVFYGHFYFYHNQTGVAYGFVGTSGQKQIQGVDIPDHWWFRFGCDHAGSIQKTIGNCRNLYTCPKCGYVEDVDSSG